MRSLPCSILRLTVLLLLPALALAALPPRVPVSELSPGQTGYGLTVFQGTVPDTFQVTILGVRHQARAGGDIILVELSGQDLEETAVAQGMSGSPVYLDDGRLLGAVAFGWPGALRPIAGLTPAAELDAAAARDDTKVSRATMSPAGPADLLGTPAATHLAAALLGAAAPPAIIPAAGEPWPSPETLALRLFPPANAAAAAGNLAPLEMGLYALPAGAAAATATTVTSPTLVPGSACAVALITGDAQLGAIGTVSTVDGARVVCMAHPFMQFGPVDLPLATAEIVTLFPSREISFKMGSAGPVVGRITHDLRAGLAGELGAGAPTTPVQVTVDLPTGRRDFRFDVARQTQLTPQLVLWCLYNTLLVEGDDRSDQLVRYDITLDLADGAGRPLAPVTLEGVTGGSGGVAALAADWQAPLAILLNNRHEPLSITGIEARLAVERPARAAWIKSLHAPARIAAGEEFTVEVELEQRHGPTIRERFTLTAPADLGPGPLRLGAASAREFFQLDAVRAAGLFADHGLAATFDLLNRPRSLDELTVALVAAESGMTAGGRELVNLPESVKHTLRGGPPGAVQPTMAAYKLRTARRLGMILNGYAVQDVAIHQQSAPRAEGDRP